MPLVFGDEVVTKYLKFNAKEKTWSFNDSDGEIVEIEPPKLLMDLHNIQTGWFCFRESQAPDVALDPPGTEAESLKAGITRGASSSRSIPRTWVSARCRATHSC